MDYVDILITLVIFAVFIGSEVLKINKKMASTATKTETKTVETDEDFEPIEVDYFVEKKKGENEKYETNSSKSPSYFTYEDISASENETQPSVSAKPASSKEIHLQEVENETETSSVDLQNPEELRKAIIYGEILKNPYN